MTGGDGKVTPSRRRPPTPALVRSLGAACLPAHRTPSSPRRAVSVACPCGLCRPVPVGRPQQCCSDGGRDTRLVCRTCETAGHATQLAVRPGVDPVVCASWRCRLAGMATGGRGHRPQARCSAYMGLGAGGQCAVVSGVLWAAPSRRIATGDCADAVHSGDGASPVPPVAAGRCGAAAALPGLDGLRHLPERWRVVVEPRLIA